MNSSELYDRIKELDAFNERYKTKVIYQAIVNKELENDMVIISAHAIGFIHHGKKYELVEFTHINLEESKMFYEFNEVDDFTRYTDKEISLVQILNDDIEIPKDKVKEFFNVTCCENTNPDYVYEEDIILKDFVVLSEKRLIDGQTYEGVYTTFFGKFIEKEEYEQFLGEKSRHRNLLNDLEIITTEEFEVDINDFDEDVWDLNDFDEER